MVEKTDQKTEGEMQLFGEKHNMTVDEFPKLWEKYFREIVL